MPMPSTHIEQSDPSPWVARFVSTLPPGCPVLDVACGGGRHARLLAAAGHPVTAVDIDVSRLVADDTLEVVQADLEGGPWPLDGRRFGGVVVTNYLWRPILDRIVDSVSPDGALIYETFAVGNERFGKPSNPDFLLRPGELLDIVRGRLEVVAYEHGDVTQPRPAVVQRICAVAGGRHGGL